MQLHFNYKTLSLYWYITLTLLMCSNTNINLYNYKFPNQQKDHGNASAQCCNYFKINIKIVVELLLCLNCLQWKSEEKCQTLLLKGCDWRWKCCSSSNRSNNRDCAGTRHEKLQLTTTKKQHTWHQPSIN